MDHDFSKGIVAQGNSEHPRFAAIPPIRHSIPAAFACRAVSQAARLATGSAGGNIRETS
jgi:hypothetical protein